MTTNETTKAEQLQEIGGGQGEDVGKHSITWEAAAAATTDNEMYALLTIASAIAGTDTAGIQGMLKMIADSPKTSLIVGTLLMTAICELSSRRRELQTPDRN